jgi:hypothetical protein
MFHGNPTWSYLYRKVIGQLLMKKNVRVIAPDMGTFKNNWKFAKLEFNNRFILYNVKICDVRR